ncbi:MAG: hypothetical protein IJH20_06420 [Bacilli bacterium]|nr:hypothetical protein [Bacilli bacterium]
MKNKLIVKTILSCLLGAIIWCVLDYIICLVKKESFVDTFFSTKNLIELVICMIAAGIAYYSAQKKKNGTN